MAEVKSEGYMAQILKPGSKRETSVGEKYYYSRHNFNETNTIFFSLKINNLFSD